MSGRTITVRRRDGGTIEVRELSWGEFIATETPLQDGDFPGHRLLLAAACTGMTPEEVAALDMVTGRRLEAAIYELHPPIAQALDDAGED